MRTWTRPHLHFHQNSADASQRQHLDHQDQNSPDSFISLTMDDVQQNGCDSGTQSRMVKSHSNGPTTSSPINEGHGLPKKFLGALRDLFDVLDDKRTGLLRLSDIESRWVDDDSAFCPKGLIDCLRKVTPLNGYVDFDRFCAAIKICLLRNQSTGFVRGGGDTSSCNSSSITNPPYHLTVKARPASVPASDDAATFHSRKPPMSDGYLHQQHISPAEVHRSNLEHQFYGQENNNNYVPNGFENQQRSRTISMPQLPPRGQQAQGCPLKRINSEVPWKPERAFTNSLPQSRASKSKGNIMTVLRNWRDSVLERHSIRSNPSSSSKHEDTSDATTALGYQTDPGLPPQFAPRSSGAKRIYRRREPRRHTVSGIDYNSVKRLQQLEQEKELLLRGLQAVDRAKDWYLRQINDVQDKIRFTGQGGYYPPGDSTLEANQERINFKTNRIIAANQHLVALMDEATFPIHMNLAFRPLLAPYTNIPAVPDYNLSIRRLRDQNRMLTDEVTIKCDLISKLEQEKATLIREIYHRNQPQRPVAHYSDPNETFSM